MGMVNPNSISCPSLLETIVTLKPGKRVVNGSAGGFPTVRPEPTVGAMDVQYEIVCKCRAWGSCYLRRDSLDWTQSQFRSILVVTIAQTKVLVVDDEPELVQLLKDWLEEDGFEVFTATESAAGLRLFFQNHPDLTIADLRMPGMDGSSLSPAFERCRTPTYWCSPHWRAKST